MTSLLVLGGSSFVGRALVEEGLARGWVVTTFNRGLTPGAPWVARPQAGGAGAPVGGGAVERLVGDRLDAASLLVLTGRDWDVVADTWSGAPAATRASSAVLAPRTARYVYVSSGSVYAPPPPFGVSESAPTVEAAPDAEGGEYPTLKRGSELAVLDAFGERALLARAGLILGPHEDVGRLPWWLTRMARGGEVLAPGPAELPLQFVDARDLARFVLSTTLTGAVNVVGRRGHATMRSLLEACRDAVGGDARLTWVDEAFLTEQGVEAWTELPIWLPPAHEYAAMHAADVSRAHAAGLACRPVAETVADTWAWLRALDGPPPLRTDLPPLGLAPERESELLVAARG